VLFCLLSDILLSSGQLCLTSFPVFLFAAGYERLARARLGLPEVEDTVAATAEDNQTTSSIMEMEHPSASDTLITTTSFNDDDSNFDMFGDDDIPDATGSSNAKTVDASGTSGTEGKFLSLANFFCGKLLQIIPSYTSILYSQIFSPYLQKLIMEV
jgi:hypothetical protein